MLFRSNFAAKSLRELFKLLNIQSRLSTTYHPQTDGTTERFNQEIEAYLSIYCSSFPTDWLETLPILEFVHNSRRHSDRKRTPFELIYGTQPTGLPDTFKKTDIPSTESRLEELLLWRSEALAAHELAKLWMASQITSTFTPFKVGQRVWLEAKNLIRSYNKKIAPKREGPFVIDEVLGPVTYRLRLPKSWKVHPVFHATLLSPYKETEIHGPNFGKPMELVIDGETEYKVEKIIGRQGKGSSRKYLIKWKGTDDNENSWEPFRNLKNA